MKNKVKYAKEIMEIACDGDAIAISKTTGKPNRCGNVGCEDCMRYTGRPGCAESRLREWAESEYIEKQAISKKDRAFLRYIDGEFKHIVRDSDGVLKIFSGDVVKCRESWKDEIGLEFWEELSGFNVQFPMVKWSDESPWLIEDLKKLKVVEEYD